MINLKGPQRPCLQQGDAEAGAEAEAVELLTGDDMAAELEEAGDAGVDEIGTSAPTDDFDRLLERGRTEAAFSGLPPVILELVNNSMSNRCSASKLQG